jgi:hypothetical protein
VISPHRSRKHLDFVRKRPCAFCLHPAEEAHHHSRKSGGGGVGLKGCDLLTVPLCSSHHRELHKRGEVAPYSRSETAEILWKAVALCLRARVLEGEES